MQTKLKYFLASISGVLLLGAGGMPGSVANAANVAAPTELGGEAPTFLGGLWVAETRPVTSLSSMEYRPYDAEAIGRHLPREAEPGIDPIQTAAIVPGVFRSVAIPIRNFPVSARWAGIYRSIAACAGNACGRDNKNFAKMVGAARQDGFLAKLDRVNRGVNALIAYKDDKAVYGRLDYWARPAETLKRGAGDCEDFAILKMAALIDAGIPAQSMSLVVLQDKEKGVFHAVLSVTTGSGNFILDNLRNAVVKDTALPSYVPLYSFSTDRAWIHGAKKGGGQVAETKDGFASVAPGQGLDRRAARPAMAGG